MNLYDIKRKHKYPDKDNFLGSKRIIRMKSEQRFSKKAVKKELVADWQALERVFIRPEDHRVRAALVKYMEQILFGLHDFLHENVGITEEASLLELSERYTSSHIPEHPARKLAEEIEGIISKIAPHAVNVASPYFIGHMTSAIPFFMVHLQTIVAALNQNPVKLETSKVVSILERQTLARLHRMIFRFDDEFYYTHIQRPESTLGGFVEDGTLANLTALWVARNRLLAPVPGFEGVEINGMAEALRVHDVDRMVVLVSRMGHYSLRKSSGILGIGNRNVLSVDTDDKYCMDTRHLRQMIRDIKKHKPKTRIMAVIGIAGTTETGSVDPLSDIADICAKEGIHFHVDAAWGGPTLLSEKYRHLLEGIEKADSVTIDGHKQFYMPMSCGMVYFRDPLAMDAIAYHAAYVIRPGSVDLGIRSIVGSRAATSLILNSALDIMGAKGYELLLDHGIEMAKELSLEIRKRPLFELTSNPMLNILTYRIFPEELKKSYQKADYAKRLEVTREVDRINIILQRLQREAGNSFVSRTTLTPPKEESRVVLRSVLMNPMTDMDIIKEVLDEQEEIYRTQIATS